MKNSYKIIISLLLNVLFLTGCTKPTPGPDKVFAGEAQGAILGAGAGAVTGFQVGAGTGPGAVVGAGVGAVAGAVQGYMEDSAEEQALKIAKQLKTERRQAVVHEILNDNYKRRLEIHPSRDIYPADLFFVGDESKLCPTGASVVKELAKLNKYRLPWSRLVVASYVKSSDQNSEFSRLLAEKRAKAIGDTLVRNGIEPRRIEARAVVVDAPILIDPLDHPARYSQAIELIPLDR